MKVNMLKIFMMMKKKMKFHMKKKIKFQMKVKKVIY